MASANGHNQQGQVQKICTLWVHDSNFSTEDVVIDLNRVQELGLQSGSLAQILPLRQRSPKPKARDYSPRNALPDKADGSHSLASEGRPSMQRRRSNSFTTVDEGGGPLLEGARVERQKAYVFVVKDASPELKAKFPALQISVSQSIATAFGFRNRMQVAVTTADEVSHLASHVEIAFKDEYLSRADMWRLVVSELSHKTVYRDQRILCLGTIRAIIKNVWINGQKKRSGYFTGSTKPIFRSQSAKFIVFIQMSKEMWDFDTEGSGEIMFNKVINGFLPELFKNWMSIQAKHLVSIVLFSRIEYDEQDQHALNPDSRSLAQSSAPESTRDFYRVVVSEMASNDWIKILYQLKKEFLTFRQDILVQRVRKTHSTGTNSTKGGAKDGIKDSGPEYAILGKPCIASKGNILEAISLASSQFSRDHIDRDLVRTGISVIVITAGSGIYEVDYTMLKLATDTLIGRGIGIDLVCLSPMPLHSVPLFKYRTPKVVVDDVASVSPVNSLNPDDSTPRAYPSSFAASFRSLSTTPTRAPKITMESVTEEWSYAVPYWIDVSFWRGTADEQAMIQRQKRSAKSKQNGKHSRRSDFALRCRMYELQMMGVMENDMNSIIVAYLHKNPLHPWQRIQHYITDQAITEQQKTRINQLDREWMENYDDNVFKTHKQRKEVEQRAKDTIEKLGSKLSTSTQDSASLKPWRVEDSPSLAPSPGPRPGSGYLDWRLKETNSTSIYPGERRPSRVSLATTADNVSVRSYRPSRQISFGLSGLAAPKASLGTDLTTSSVLSKPAVFAKDGSSGRAEGLTGVAQQFRAVLNRGSIQQITSPIERESTEDSSGSTKPIDIGSIRRPNEHSRTSSGELDVKAALIAKGGHSGSYSSSRLSPDKLPESGAIMAASSARRRGTRVDLPQMSNSATLRAPQKMSPIRALSPWLLVINPCNPRRNDLSISAHFGRWQHVFPRQLRNSTIKWNSLCSPASVPLTNEVFPNAEQLRTDYEESPYRLSQNTENDLTETPTSREALVRELIGFRLAHGFQFAIGASVADSLGSEHTNPIRIFDKDYMAKDGSSLFMLLGTAIHQISCTAGGEVEIRRFTRKASAAVEPALGPKTPAYRPYIRTALQHTYSVREVNFEPLRSEHNWSAIDNFLAGYGDEFSDPLRFWRARFVLIPVEIPPHKGRPLVMLTEDSAEEIRLEGIKKLTQTWQRSRVVPAEERTYQSMRRRKDPNPLAIEYQTRDPSVVIAAGLGGAQLSETDPHLASTTLFLDHETYTTKGVDLAKLATDLQGDHGITMLDRRWHLRLYYNCFVGVDFTTWLLDRFRDIETRDDAVAFGNELMQQGLFQHVQRKHQFRDGQYFYQMAPEYGVVRPETRSGWFGSRRGDRSVPATPMAETPRTVSTEKSGTRADAFSPPEKMNEKTPKQEAADSGRKVMLSHVMRYDVDPRKRSYRPEHVNLHYDRLHNPDNCYHIRVDWMNTTAKFIEDAITSWAGSVDRFGLKLVELPLAEASSVTETHPFRAPYRIKLALAPPTAPSLQYFDTTSFTPHLQTDKLFFQKALLRKLQFVLDMEAASSFPADVDVRYSWGKPDYRYTQFIHKTGLVLAQITDEGELLLLANRLCNSRASGNREGARLDAFNADGGPDRRPPNTPGLHVGRRSPMASPLFRPIHVPDQQRLAQQAAHERLSQRSAEEIKDQVEAFCHNKDALRAFYEDAIDARRALTSPSPRVPPTPLLDSSVPSLRLPPNINTLSSPQPSARRNKPASLHEEARPVDQ